MSKFWAGDSGSESDDISESDSNEDEREFMGAGASKYMGDDSSDESWDTGGRVVRSAKDRRVDELNSLSDQLRESMNDSEWASVQTNFEKFTKVWARAAAQGQFAADHPVLVRLAALLESRIGRALADKAGRKQMISTNAKALVAMKQRIRKHNKPLEKQIAAVRMDPKFDVAAKAPDGSGEDEDDQPDDDDQVDDDELYHFEIEEAEEEDDEDDDDDFDDEDDEDDEGDEDEDSEARLRRRRRRRRRLRLEREAQQKQADADAGKWDTARLKRAINELLAKRGLKGTSAQEQIARWSVLLEKARGMESRSAVQELRLLMHSVAAQFDAQPSMTAHMAQPAWQTVVRSLHEIVEHLKANPALHADEQPASAATSVAVVVAAVKAKGAAGSAGEATADDGADGDGEGDDGALAAAALPGSLVAFFERLDDEWLKAVRKLDPHKQEYVSRLRDEITLLDLADQAVQYYTERMQREPEQQEQSADGPGATGSAMLPTSSGSLAARVAVRIFEHLYFRPASQASAADGAAAAAAPIRWIGGQDHTAFLDRLADLVHRHGTERNRTRVILCSIFRLAQRNQFHRARDALLMTRLQDTVSQADVATQILYNRTMAQLGLCAFRAGLVYETHTCLADMCSSNRLRELLAQGSPASTRFQSDRGGDPTDARLTPFHMHLNLDMLEAAHLISAMVLEVPCLAAQAHDPRRKPVSRAFRRRLHEYGERLYTAPPETSRDVIMAAAQHMKRGHWQPCVELLRTLKLWALVPDAERTQTLLEQRVREESLRTFLFAHAPVFTSLSLDSLATQFSLPRHTTHSICSKMMAKDELPASWDQPSDCLVVHKVEPSRLQFLSLLYADKAASFVENNERMFEAGVSGSTTSLVNKDSANKRSYTKRRN